MEIVIGLLLMLAVPLVMLLAKRGAEAAQRERERRWAAAPVRPPVTAARLPSTTLEAGRGGGERPGAKRARRGLTGSRGPQAAAAALRARGPQSPSRREPAATAPGTRPSGAASRSGSPAAVAVAARDAAPPIDINTASVEELRSLPGVGVRAAQRIVAHRERHGAFASLEELEAVEGFDHRRVGRLATRAKV